MITTTRLRNALWLPLLLAGAGAARATVVEPSGLMVPAPQSQLEIDTARNTNPLFPLVSLDALFKSRDETINWSTDANKKPDTFSPVCGFTAELVLRGGGCRIDFGWYNANGTKPTDAQIYPLITAAQITALPLEAYMPGAGQRGPTFNAASILNSPNYAGGLIGFATKGATGTFCTQTHYSQQAYNVLCTAATCRAADNDNHWIASVIYKSTVDPNAYYLAFEDLPMSAASFEGEPGQMYKNDGDMNDFVFYVTGVTCPGGGRACATTQPGVCHDGVNECQPGGGLVCKTVIPPSAERCDGLDNDCNGMTDDGASLCPPGLNCVKGECIGPCGDVEFPCSFGQVCREGFCVDPSCVDITCPAGQVCRSGACRAPCDGVMCPLGQVCRVGRCLDPCAGVTCDGDRVCRGGVCVPKCQCLACDTGLACETGSGRCVSDGCQGMTCAAGMVCDKGTCVDGCTGATCPSGQRCEAGNCVDIPGGGGTGGSSGGTGGGRGGAGGLIPVRDAGASGAAGAGGQSGGTGSDGEVVGPRRTPPSCRCEFEPGPHRAGLFGVLALVAVACGARRPRRGRTRGQPRQPRQTR